MLVQLHACTNRGLSAAELPTQPGALECKPFVTIRMHLLPGREVPAALALLGRLCPFVICQLHRGEAVGQTTREWRTRERVPQYLTGTVGHQAPGAVIKTVGLLWLLGLLGLLGRACYHSPAQLAGTEGKCICTDTSPTNPIQSN